MSEFKIYWETMNKTADEYVGDRALSQKDLMEVRNTIIKLQKKGKPSSKIIEVLQKMNAKLFEKWRAERAYFTEIKLLDTQIVHRAAEELGVTKYRVVLSPSACPLCLKKSNNGKKIFTDAEVKKAGDGFIPWHPNCYCVLIPTTK